MDKPVIAVRVRDDAHARIAWALGSHPAVGKVAMLGHKVPASWSDLVVPASRLGTPDIVVDPDPTDEGIVVTAGESDRPGITHASLEGLARSLQSRLDDSGSTSVWTPTGRPLRDGDLFHFPPPLGALLALEGEAPVEGDIAGVGAFRAGGSLVVIDDRRFLETVCIAAGGAVADIAITRPTPVWERADAYIAACEELGVVVAEGTG